ncbi:hypothetical protein IEO_05597 [Bacillus wiedmannii]|nr:hypothetical protein IEO_05597 [Bacillus wiedmannii]
MTVVVDVIATVIVMNVVVDVIVTVIAIIAESGKLLLERALNKSALFLYVDFLVLFVKEE